MRCGWILLITFRTEGGDVPDLIVAESLNIDSIALSGSGQITGTKRVLSAVGTACVTRVTQVYAPASGLEVKRWRGWRWRYTKLWSHCATPVTCSPIMATYTTEMQGSARLDYTCECSPEYTGYACESRKCQVIAWWDIQLQMQHTASKHVRIEDAATVAADDVNAMKASKDLHAKGLLAREMHGESLATVLEHANLCCA